MLLLRFAFEDVEYDVRLVLGGLELEFLLRLEFDSDALLLTWLQVALHGVDSEYLPRMLLLHGETVLNRVHADVFQNELVFFGFTDSDGLKVQDLLMAELYVKGDLESLSAKFNLLVLLLDVVSLGVLYLKSQLRVELLLLLCSEGNLHKLLLAGLDSAIGLRHNELLRQAFNTC